MGGNTFPPRKNTHLKFAILRKYPTQRAFLDDLRTGSSPVSMSESKLSDIINHRRKPKPEERRAFAWRLQAPAEKLFPAEEAERA